MSTATHRECDLLTSPSGPEISDDVHPFTFAGALSHASILAPMLHNTAPAERLASESFALAAEHGLALWRSVAGIARAWATLGDGPPVSTVDAIQIASLGVGAGTGGN